MSIPDKAVEAGAERLRMDGHSMLGCGSLSSSEDTVRGILEAAGPYLTGGRCWLRTGLEAIIQEAEDAATDEIPFADLIAPEKLRALLAHHSEVES